MVRHYHLSAKLTRSFWREIRPLLSCESDVEGATRVPRSPLILRKRKARKGTNRAGEGERQSSAPKNDPAPP